MRKQTKEEMIQNVMQHFDFKRVQEVMKALKWGGNSKTPCIETIKKNAKIRMLDAIELVLSPTNKINKNTPFISQSGGFKATAYKTKKNNLSEIQLEFIVANWQDVRKIEHED